MTTQTLKKWQKMKLDDLGSVERGRSRHRPRNDAILYGGQYPFIQTGDVKNANLYIDSYSQTYNENGLAQSKLWDIDTLCITIAANIAESAILKIPACFPDSIVSFRSYEGKSDIRFVKYLLDVLKEHFLQISKGTTQDNLSLEKILSITFKVPEFGDHCPQARGGGGGKKSTEYRVPRQILYSPIRANRRMTVKTVVTTLRETRVIF